MAATNKARQAAPDWESIEKHYRAGVLSLREIGKQHGVSDTAIRKKAKEYGWERDLTAKVAEKVRTELVRSEVRSAHANDPRTERQIVEQAALTVVAVVREHRTSIATGRNIVAVLSEQLLAAAGQRDDLEDLITLETKSDASSERRAKLMKAVGLPVHAATARDLSTALKNLIALERQAFNVPDVAEPDPDPADSGTAKAVTDGFAELKAAFAAQASKHADPA